MVEYLKQLSPLLSAVSENLLTSVMETAYNTSVSTYILTFINWAYVKNQSYEAEEIIEYQYLGTTL